jgi:hypothetical protein
MPSPSSKRITTQSRCSSTIFEDAKIIAMKEKIIARAVEELKIHARFEEEIFYGDPWLI